MFSRCQTLLLRIAIEEPFLFLRPFLHGILQEHSAERTQSLIQLRAFISMSKYHPPAVSFYLFNNLLGLLKWTQEDGKPFGLYTQATILPLLSELVLSMNGLKYSDFKKERVEIFLSTSGGFWYPLRKGAGKSLFFFSSSFLRFVADQSFAFSLRWKAF